MGWGFRKSLNVGPLRINASKSGLGYSFGGRGLRVGRDAKGRSYTAASIPGTGIYKRSYRSTAGARARTAHSPAAGLPARQTLRTSNTSNSSYGFARIVVYGLAASGIYCAVSLLLHLF